MAHLPPVGCADVATKHDLAQLEERMNMRFEMVNERFDSLEERISLRFEAQDARFDGKLDRLEARLTNQMVEMAATFTRTTVMSVVGSLLTFTGVIFAARLV